MKNGMKKTAAVVMAAMLMGTGAVIPAAEDMGDILTDGYRCGSGKRWQGNWA